MPVTNGYCTLPELKTWIGNIPDTNDDANLELAINSASRWIDSYCKRRFWLDSSATARTFVADDSYLLNIDDLGNTTGFVLKIDADRDGTFETTLAASDYLLLEDDAASSYPEAAPYTRIQAVGSYVFPLRYPGILRQAAVQVTGRWGWPAVPEAVKHACLIKAHQLFTRRKSPEGVAGFNDFGPVRLQRDIDPDIVGLLAQYRLVNVYAG